MFCSTCELRDKEVINVCDGNRLGQVADFEVDAACGRIAAIIVCPDTVGGILFSKGRVRIPWDRIVRIGRDAVLVEAPRDANGCGECSEGQKKGLKKRLGL